MNNPLNNILPALDFNPLSKVWLFTSSKSLSENECLLIQQGLNDFCANWDSHGVLLKAKATILLNRIIVLMVDESNQFASGCSIDKSVTFLKGLEKNYPIYLFDRLLHTGYVNTVWETHPTHIWTEKLSAGEIDMNTPFLDMMTNN